MLALPDELLKICQKVEYVDATRGRVRRDLRRALKSLAMKYRMPTQLLLEKTSDGTSDDYPSEVARDFFTALYYKAGGLPWGPVGLSPGSCYIGISFFRPLDEDDSLVQTSLVQAFDEHGDGLVLRGQDFRWDPAKEGTRSPHLSGDHAEWLMNMALDRYKLEMEQEPHRVVIHKTSRFLEDERTGFEEVLQKRVAKYDLVTLSPDSTVRLFPLNQYPPLRGTRFSVGNLDYLYTNGFSSDLQQFHGKPRAVTAQIGRAFWAGYPALSIAERDFDSEQNELELVANGRFASGELEFRQASRRDSQGTSEGLRASDEFKYLYISDSSQSAEPKSPDLFL